MSSRVDGLEAWRAAVSARQAREQDVDRAVDALIQAGLDGALSWAQVDDVLTALRYGQESELASEGIADCGTSVEVNGAPRGSDQSMEEAARMRGTVTLAGLVFR